MAVLIQWNLDGYHRRSSELKQLISQHHPIVIALQESHLRPSQNISHQKYNIFRHGSFEPWPQPCLWRLSTHDLKILYISTISHPLWSSNRWCKSQYTWTAPPTYQHLLNIYPPLTQHKLKDISFLLNSLPPPFIFCGDFNAHSPTWGVLSDEPFRTNSRGNIIDHALTANHDLHLLNTPGTPTHLNSTYGTLSSIDLSFCSSSLAPSLSWSTHPDLCDSDHFPIILTSDKIQYREYIHPPRWLLQKADWTQFHNLTSNTSSLPDPANIQESISAFTNLILEAAKTTISSPPESANQARSRVGHKTCSWPSNFDAKCTELTNPLNFKATSLNMNKPARNLELLFV